MIEVTSLDHNGRGIAKLNNKIVFIDNALPSEIVEIKINNEKKKFIEAETTNIIKSSNIRINSKCPYFYECGGCDLLHISYKDQLKFKQEKIQNIIDKYLNKPIKASEIVKCDDNFNYRNKVTFQVKEKIGFYKKKTYEIIPIDKCLISNELINNSIKYLNMLDLDTINKIICRTGSNQLMIIIDTYNDNLNIDYLKEIADSIYLKIKDEYKLVYGNRYIYEIIERYKYLVSPDSFFQINLNTCNKLYSKIKEYVGINKKILDLYCGTGSISIFVSEENNVLGIEVNKYAVKDANENKLINKLDNINFLCGESGKQIYNLNFNPDLIIVDPPRNGLNSETINNIIKLNSNQIIYVSCDPMTLMRDLNLLEKHYNINSITPFDMFPNTKHVECLVLLTIKV